MSDGVAPSKGAMRAAQVLWTAREWNRPADLAEVIDRETKSPQMAAMLRKLANTLALGYSYKSIDELAREAERLLSELEVNPELSEKGKP